MLDKQEIRVPFLSMAGFNLFHQSHVFSESLRVIVLVAVVSVYTEPKLY